MPFSKAVQEAILRHVLGNSSWTFPSAPYVSWHTGFPGYDGQLGLEVTGGGYVRKQISVWTYELVANFWQAKNTNQEQWSAASADWASGANITHYGLWKGSTTTLAADFVGWHQIPSPKPVLNGEIPTVPAGDIAILHGGT